MATIGGIISLWAMIARRKSEGVPVNFNVLKFIFGFALAMWVGVAFTNVAYNITPTNAAIFAFCIGGIFSVFLMWQTNSIVRKMCDDAQTIKELSTQCSLTRSEERRVGKECRSRWSPEPSKIRH